MKDLERIRKLQQALHSWGVDSLIINRQSDLQYLTGLELSTGSLLVSQKEVLLFIDGRYFETCKKTLHFEVILQTKDSLKRILKRKSFSDVKILGFDCDFLSYAGYTSLKEICDEASKLLARSLTLIPIARPLQAIRSIKDPIEIEKLRKSASLCCEGFEFVISLLKEGVTEKAIATDLEIFWKKKGCGSNFFSPYYCFWQEHIYASL